MEKQQEERTPITNTAPYKISDKCQTMLKKFNVVLFKNCLDKKGQKQLLRDCGDIMEIGKNPNLLERTKFKNYSKKAVPILFWNWPAVKDSLSYPEIYRPASLLELSTTLFDLARSKVQEEKHSVRVHYANSKGMAFPAEYSPNALYGILYPHGGSFIPHVDGAKQWALAISVGESARFFVCETECGAREYIQIDSGDAIIFKGGVLYHGVESIIPNTAPKFWYKEDSKFRVFDMARFNLQFRDPKNDRLEYYPCFKEIDRGAMPFSK